MLKRGEFKHILPWFRESFNLKGSALYSNTNARMVLNSDKTCVVVLYEIVSSFPQFLLARYFFSEAKLEKDLERNTFLFFQINLSVDSLFVVHFCLY